MSESAYDALPDPDVDVESIAPETLSSRIDDGDSVFVLDTRVSSEFDEWHIEGESVTVENVPYFHFIDGGVDEELLADVPADEEVVALCAKGGASEFVAGLLIEEGYDAVNLDEGMNGWASIYEAYELETDADATILQYQRPSSGCLSHLVVSDGEAAVIDPLRVFTDRYVEDAADHGVDITYAIDTHVHADHISGVRALGRNGAAAIIPAPAGDRGVAYDAAYETVEDGDTIPVGEETIEVIHAPGHTTGMTNYRVGNVLFTGDGLFTESVARPDLEKGDEGAPEAAGLLYDTFQETVLSLPGDTVVAPGHFSDAADPAPDGTYTAQLGDLLERMDALTMDRDAFVEFVLSDMPPRPANYEDIIATNLGRRDADDAEAFEMELGPNNCAASRDSLAGD